MRRSPWWLAVLIPAALDAQAPTRKIEGELSGNAFYGNTRQVLASVRAERERTDSAFSLLTSARFNYGQTTTDEAGTVVSKRSWIGMVSYDFRPFADFSPFFKGTAESSFENKIRRRYSLGSGTRMNFIRNDQTELIGSLGAAAEQTLALPPGDSAGAVTRARGLSSLKWRRDIGARLSVTSEGAYQPALGVGGDYTLTGSTTFKLKLASFAALTVGIRDNYDSMSRLRGARTNNDGELLFGILTTF